MMYAAVDLILFIDVFNMKKIKKLLPSLLALSLYLLSTQPVHAQLGTLTPPPETNVSITSFIGSALGFAIGSGLVVFLFLFSWGSIQWLMSEGDKAALQAARGRIVSAVIGLILLSTAWAIFSLVQAITYKSGP